MRDTYPMAPGLTYHHSAYPTRTRLTFNGADVVVSWPAGLRATRPRCAAALAAWQAAGAAAPLAVQDAADAVALAGLSGEVAWFGARCRQRAKAQGQER